MALLIGSILVPAWGQELSGALKKIKQSGAISIGYYEAEIPFSYLDGKGQIIGYSYEITQKIIQAVSHELKLPKLEVHPIQLTLHNRFSMVQNEVVDIECGVSTNNNERKKQIAFSNTFFISRIRLMTRKDAKIVDFPDLRGKVAVTKASSTAELLLYKLNMQKNYKINIISAVERSVTPLTLLQTGQADAYVLDDILLYGAIADSWRPAEWIITGLPQSFEAYGCMMRKNDPAFKAVVDQAIAKLMQSGEAAQLYKKWFMLPIPPKGRALNFPMSEEMVKLYSNPNDHSFD